VLTEVIVCNEECNDIYLVNKREVPLCHNPCLALAKKCREVSVI